MKRSSACSRIRRKLSRWALRSCSFWRPVSPFRLTSSSSPAACAARGDTRYTAVVTAITVLGVRSLVCIALISVFHLGLWGAWIALVVDQCMRTVLMGMRYHSGKWKQISVKNTIHAGK